MVRYEDYKNRELQNEELKKEYDALQPEYDLIQAMIDVRTQQNIAKSDSRPL